MLDKDNLFFGLRESFTAEQESFVNAIFDTNVKVIVTPSVAGTGKTTLTVGAAKILQRELVYVFPNIGEDEFGHRPGSLFEKQWEYLGPLFDALDKIGDDPYKCIWNEDAMKDVGQRKDQMERLRRGQIWVYPKAHGFLRGRNLEGNKIIFIDECQNYTKAQLKKIITRVHDDSILVLAGHMGQCDLRDISKSGFPAYIDFYKNCEYAKVIELTKCFRGRIASDADKV